VSRRLCVWLPAAALLPLCLLALAAPGENRQAGAGRTDKPARRPLMVAFSTETNGYLTPCGCSSPMLGGFPRRAGYLGALARQAALVRVDNGDLTEALGRQDELKAETLVDMFNRLRYDALNIGEKDFRLGLPYLQSLQGRFKGALLCANARKADGAPLFGEYVVVNREVAGKPARVLIAGMLSDQFAPQVTALNLDVSLEAPSAALERLRAVIAARGDIRVLLYHGPKAEAEQIARQFPIFHLIVCAHEGDHPLDTTRTGGAALVGNGQDGKYMGRAKFTGTFADVEYTPLGPDFKDDPAIVQIKAAYLERVTAEDLLGKVPRGPTLNGDTFAGSAACEGCHVEASRIWKASGHAHALQTLADVREDKDPECVTCHVVGLARQSGFISREKTPQLANVGCESCHGAATRHTKDPTKVSLPKAGSASCVGCHNPQNSPKFDFDTYWSHIKH
jgi:hypothetical protein